jgi:hypothetical protein
MAPDLSRGEASTQTEQGGDTSVTGTPIGKPSTAEGTGQHGPMRPPLAWRDAVKLGLAVTLVWRVGLGALLASAWMVSGRLLPLGPNPSASLFDGLPWYASLAGQAILGVWPRWDAVHHLNLARLGYFGVGVPDSVYYPLYASLVGAVTRGLTQDYVVGGLLVSTLATAGTLVLLYLIADQLRGRETARLSVLVMAAYPTAFFLMAPFTESLFICLTLAAFLAAYRGRWWLAGPPAMLASLARGPGMLTGAALAWLGWVQWRQTQRPRRLRQLIPSLIGAGLAVVGGLGFQAWRALAGFPPMTVILETGSKLAWVGPLAGVGYAFSQVIHKPEFLTILETASAMIFTTLLVAMLVRPAWRRGEWLLYMGINLILFTGVHTFEASAWRSIARYVLILFPGFIVIADWLTQRSKGLRFGYFTLSLTLQIIFGSLYAVFWFIG